MSVRREIILKGMTEMLQEKPNVKWRFFYFTEDSFKGDKVEVFFYYFFFYLTNLRHKSPQTLLFS